TWTGTDEKLPELLLQSKSIGATQYRVHGLVTRMPWCFEISCFWESVKKPSLVKYLEFRLHEGDINNLETEHHSYIMELNTIAKHCAESPEIVQKIDKSSEEVNLFWNLHQNIHTEIKLYEKKAHLHRSKLNDLKDQISIKQTQHILDATKETLSQNLTLQRTIIKQHLLGKTDVSPIENSEPVTGQKRSYEEELPSTPPNKSDVQNVEDEGLVVKSTADGKGSR
ncbi:5100_t:CDS:2, partial [Paraglomus occultum]